MTHITDKSRSEVGLRERKKRQTRIAIHDAAFRLIDEHGLEATTIDQICSDADVSTRTFFNYYRSKADAAFEIPSTAIDDELRDRFHSAHGGLVAALCDVIGESADRGPNRLRAKKLALRHPELLTTMAQMMTEVRDQFVSLAAERAQSREQAELAVALVMSALSLVMHDQNGSDLSLSSRLKETVDLLAKVNTEKFR